MPSASAAAVSFSRSRDGWIICRNADETRIIS
jgi:hypothetical protein